MPNFNKINASPENPDDSNQSGGFESLGQEVPFAGDIQEQGQLQASGIVDENPSPGDALDAPTDMSPVAEQQMYEELDGRPGDPGTEQQMHEDLPDYPENPDINRPEPGDTNTTQDSSITPPEPLESDSSYSME